MHKNTPKSQLSQNAQGCFLLFNFGNMDKDFNMKLYLSIVWFLKGKGWGNEYIFNADNGDTNYKNFIDRIKEVGLLNERELTIEDIIVGLDNLQRMGYIKIFRNETNSNSEIRRLSLTGRLAKNILLNTYLFIV